MKRMLLTLSMLAMAACEPGSVGAPGYAMMPTIGVDARSAADSGRAVEIPGEPGPYEPLDIDQAEPPAPPSEAAWCATVEEGRQRTDPGKGWYCAPPDIVSCCRWVIELEDATCTPVWCETTAGLWRPVWGATNQGSCCTCNEYGPGKNGCYVDAAWTDCEMPYGDERDDSWFVLAGSKCGD
jgi:hypothetical protein